MHLQSFLQYLTHEKRYSPHTISAYKTDLLQFKSFCEKQYGDLDLKDVSGMIVRSWIVELINNNMDARSVNRKISSLKSFYRFLMRQAVIDKTPMSAVIAPKMSKKLPEVLEQKQMDRLFAEVAKQEGFEGMRDLLILELLYATGIRRSELVNLELTDFDQKLRTVRVLGKGSKERLIPISPELLSRLDIYMDERSKKFPELVESKLFVTSKGRSVYPRLVHNIVAKNLTLVSSANKKSPHVLRHTFATHLLSNGAEINAIKELMGHAGLAATQVYTHTSAEKLKEAYKKAHPKAE